jgi:hypothetical protein
LLQTLASSIKPPAVRRASRSPWPRLVRDRRGQPPKEVQILHDPEQRTAVVVQFFESAEDMAAAEGPLNAMDPGDTPGTRASIDRCEVMAQMTVD